MKEQISKARKNKVNDFAHKNKTIVAHITTNCKKETNNLFTPFATQYRQFFEYLQSHTCTATMAAIALGIYRPNVCRFKRWLEESGRLWELNKAPCKVTGFRAAYLTTNKDLAPNLPKQPSLFEELEDNTNA